MCTRLPALGAQLRGVRQVLHRAAAAALAVVRAARRHRVAVRHHRGQLLRLIRQRRNLSWHAPPLGSSAVQSEGAVHENAWTMPAAAWQSTGTG